MEEYYDVGIGYPLVFLHSFNHSKLMWLYQIPEFVSNGYRVIAPDFRGHGGRALGNEVLSFSILADDVIGLLHSLGIRRTAFVCSSAGSYVAIEVWKKNPEMVSSIILSGTKAEQDDEEILRKRRAQLLNIERDGLEHHVQNVHRRISRNTAEARPWVLDLIRTMTADMSKDAVIESLRVLISKPDYTGVVSTINVPVLIMCGLEDLFTPEIFAIKLSKQIQNSKLVLVENAGHIVPLDQPALFNRSTVDFLIQNGIK